MKEPLGKNQYVWLWVMLIIGMIGCLVAFVLLGRTRHTAQPVTTTPIAGDIAINVPAPKTNFKGRSQRKATPVPRPKGDEDITTLTIHGRVTDNTNKPVADARVTAVNRLVRLPNAADKRTATTDANGNYSMQARGLLGSVWRMTVEAAGFAPLPGAVTAQREDVEWNGILYPYSTVRGIVVDTHSRPIAGAKVFAKPALSSSNFARVSVPCSSEVLTATDGTFVINDVAQKQDIQIIASAAGYALGASARIQAPADDVKIILLHPNARVDGVVVNALGSPVIGSNVMLNLPDLSTPLGAVTDADGAFAFDNVPAQVNASVFALGQSRYDSNMTQIVRLFLNDGETTHVTLTLPPVRQSFAVHGLLVDENNNPMTNVQLEISWVSKSREVQYDDTKTNDYGRFIFEGVEDDYEIGIRGSGLLPANTQASGLVRDRERVVKRTLPVNFAATEDNITIRVTHAPSLIIKPIGPDLNTDRRNVHILYADEHGGQYVPISTEDNCCHWTVNDRMIPEQVLLFVGVYGDKIGTVEVIADEVRKAAKIGEKLTRELVIEKPEFVMHGHISCEGGQSTAWERIGLMLRNPKSGQLGKVRLPNFIADPLKNDGNFVFPVLPGYEMGIYYTWLERSADQITSTRRRSEVWLLPEDCAGRNVEFRFNRVTKSLSVKK